VGSLKYRTSRVAEYSLPCAEKGHGTGIGAQERGIEMNCGPENVLGQ
jgi:hypothetical protein